MKFSEHLLNLSESKINEANENDQTFSGEVKNFFLHNFTYTKLENIGKSEYILVPLDKFKKVGDYQARVYPEGDNKISFTFTLMANGTDYPVTLMESKVMTTTTKDYRKFAEKWFKDTSEIVEKISDIGM